MAYTKEELIALGAKDIKTARSQIVDINIFDNIDDLNLTAQLRNLIDYTMELYSDYLKLLSEFDEITREQILKSLKNTEVIDNHNVERVPYDLLRNYDETRHSTAINYLIRKLATENHPLNDYIIKKAHEILMRGTVADTEAINGYSYRKNNNYFVGYFEENENVALYYPISYDDIKQAMSIFFEFYNKPSVSIEEVFTKPFIIHGLLAVLQVFEDGNTRLARTIQHVKLFDLTNAFLGGDLDYPAIYFSKTYIPYRQEYRNLIAEIALNPSHENWYNWINFNLRRLQDQLFLNEDNLKRIRKL